MATLSNLTERTNIKPRGKRKARNVVNNHHYRYDELPNLSLRVTRHDEIIELSSSGFSRQDAERGMDFLLSRQDWLDKQKQNRQRP